MRIIDADWVLEHTKSYELSDEDWCVTGGTAIRLIHNAIDQAPTIDAVPVVRCRDCKYYEIHKPKVLENCERKGYIIPMKPDDFCSYGERKEGAE